MPFGRWWHARGRGHCRGKPGREQQHARVYRGTGIGRVSIRFSEDGRQLDDEPGEC